MAGHQLRQTGFVASVQHLSLTSGVPVRFENKSVDDAFIDVDAELIELGVIQRDQALDRLFAGRRDDWEMLPREHEREDFAEEALEEALGKEIDWRVG